MSWQGTMKDFHKQAERLGVDLEEFENEVSEEDGWYTEDTTNTFIECLIEEISNLKDSYDIKN